MSLEERIKQLEEENARLKNMVDKTPMQLVRKINYDKLEKAVGATIASKMYSYSLASLCKKMHGKNNVSAFSREQFSKSIEFCNRVIDLILEYKTI